MKGKDNERIYLHFNLYQKYNFPPQTAGRESAILSGREITENDHLQDSEPFQIFVRGSNAADAELLNQHFGHIG